MSYTFVWEHPANEVVVTGDFDNWQQTIKLQKEDGVFKKTVDLPKAKHSYKFVVDGAWVNNESAPKEDDGKGNFNNVLVPEDIKDPVSALSSAAPQSTTAALAGAVLKEADKKGSSDDVPGAFPETPAAETPFSEPKTFSVNPIPATEGLGNPVQLAPGEKVPDPSTLTSNTIQSTVKDDTEGKEAEDQKVSVAPIPATAGAGNPVHLAAGEKVPDPSTFTSNTIASTVRTDADSYEKSDAAPPQLGPVVTPDAERAAKGGMFSIPALSGALIPESSLPMNAAPASEQDPGVTIQSAAPSSTTAALAGAVSKEPRGVPEAVTESQKEAGFAPEAAANPEAVQEKKEVEQELKDKVPEEPATATNSTVHQASLTAQQTAAAAAAGATAAAGAFAAAAYSAKDRAAEVLGFNQSNATTTSGSPTTTVTDSAVQAKDTVVASIPSAATVSNTAIEAKDKVVEAVGLNQPSSTSTSASPTTTVTDTATQAKDGLVASIPSTAAVTDTATQAKDKIAETVGLNGNATPAAVSSVPDVVVESQKEAHASPEAAANAEAVVEKKEVEAELLKEVQKTNEAGEPAPTLTAATTSTAPGTESTPAAPSSTAVTAVSPVAPVSPPPVAASSVGGLNASADTPAVPATAVNTSASRDVSPFTKAPAAAEQTQPTVTTGVSDATTIPATTAADTTPKKDSTAAASAAGTPESVASGATDKKKKRRSIFGKLEHLKEKLNDKLAKKN